MKRILSLALVLMMLLSLCAVAHADWTCTCSAVNADEYAFCPECGSPKPPETWTCPNGHTELTRSFCPYCGAAKPEAETTSALPAIPMSTADAAAVRAALNGTTVWSPAASDLSFCLLRKDTFEEISLPFDLTTIDDSVVLLPVLGITNSSSEEQTFTQRWVVDGHEIVFRVDGTLAAGESGNWGLTDEEAAVSRTVGSHILQVYINDVLVATYNWQYTGAAAPAAEGSNTISSWDDMLTIYPVQSVTVSGSVLTITFRDTLPQGTDLTVYNKDIDYNADDHSVSVTTAEAGNTITVTLPDTWQTGHRLYFATTLNDYNTGLCDLYLLECTERVTYASLNYDYFTLDTTSACTPAMTESWLAINADDALVYSVAVYSSGSHYMTLRTYENSALATEIRINTYRGVWDVDVYENGRYSSNISSYSDNADTLLAPYTEIATQQMAHWANGEALIALPIQ